MQRAAYLLAHSTLVPEAYRIVKTDKKTNARVDNPSAISNCVLALNMANRLGADPLMVMQHLYIVDGHPGWSSQFVISAINTCGKYSPLRFAIEDKGETEAVYEEIVGWEKLPNGKNMPKKEKKTVKIRNKVCIAWAIEKATGERLEGPPVSMEMAVAEGWYAKTGSKWQTMPDIMLRYRAASFFGKLYAPELLMGLSTAEEEQDKVITIEPAQSSGMTLDDLAASPTQEAPQAAENRQEKKARRKAKTQAALENAEQSEPEQPEPQAMAPDEPEDAPADVEDEPRPPQESGKYQCPKEEADGGHRLVTEADCRACKSNAGCPEYRPHSQGGGAPPNEEEF